MSVAELVGWCGLKATLLLVIFSRTEGSLSVLVALYGVTQFILGARIWGQR